MGRVSMRSGFGGRLQLGLAIAALGGMAWLLAGFAHSTRTISSSAPGLSLQPCALPGVSGPAQCGTYEVFEDRAAKSGRKIKLHLVVLPALGRTPAPDAIFILHGGPGGAATDLAEGAGGGYLQRLRDHHDLVFVDQRGTGSSNPLNCDIGDDPADLQSVFGEHI